MKRKLILGASLIALLSTLSASAPAQPAGFYEVARDSGVGDAALRGAIDPLFDDSDIGETQALLVMRGGRIVAERYAPGFGPKSRLLSWSIAKSVTAVLIGLMVTDGRLVLDAPAPVPAWSQPGDPRGGITLRQLLSMTSGLEHREDEGAFAAQDSIRMLFTDGSKDMAAFAEDKPLAAPPGTVFNYSTATSVILSDIMTRALTSSRDPAARRAAMSEFIRERLMAPVGLTSLTPEYDASGTLIGGSFMHMTARDYARFGELLRNQGRVGGRQILSPRWVEFMTHPSRLNPAYGGHIWLNRAGEGSPLFPGSASRRLFASVGHGGQYVLVSPDQQLTIVRLGVSTEAQRDALKPALAKLVGVFPS